MRTKWRKDGKKERKEEGRREGGREEELEESPETLEPVTLVLAGESEEAW